MNLRRATSSAYYALFHCLARSCADLVVGSQGAQRSQRAWRQVYRAVEHGAAKNACLHGTISEFPIAIQNFANTFVALQEKRHEADYDPYARFVKSFVSQDVASVRQAIEDFNSAPIKDRRAFCVWVLMRPPRR